MNNQLNKLYLGYFSFKQKYERGPLIIDVVPIVRNYFNQALQSAFALIKLNINKWLTNIKNTLNI